MPKETEIGQRLRLYRQACGLSLRQLAAELGVAPSVLLRSETGETAIPPRIARRLPPALLDCWVRERVEGVYRSVGLEPPKGRG